MTPSAEGWADERNGRVHCKRRGGKEEPAATTCPRAAGGDAQPPAPTTASARGGDARGSSLERAGVG